MNVNYTETPEGEVKVRVKEIVDGDNCTLSVFLQMLIPLVVETYLRKRVAQALANNSSGHSHWIEHVFIPRALYVFDQHMVGGFKDDVLFSCGMHEKLESRVLKICNSGKADVFVLGLIERNFHLRLSQDKKSIIISFSETHKGIDKTLQEILKVVLSGKL